MTLINNIRFIYDKENHKIIYIDSKNNSKIEIKQCKLNNDRKIVINNKEYKTEICCSIDNNNRYWKKIFISDDENKLKILIFLQNPSNDKNIGTLEKLIKKFLEPHENYKDNIYSITFINVYSKIDTKIKNWNDLYFNNTILTDYEKSNVDAIKILLLNENYDECYIGCGQHPCTKGPQIKKYFLETYKKIVNMMLNKIISFKGFYDFTKFHIPDYPYSQKTKYNPIFRDIPTEILQSKINQIM